MRLYRTAGTPVLEIEGRFHPLAEAWDALIAREDLVAHLRAVASRGRGGVRLDEEILAPVDGQEVWAAGVTYWRSRTARMEESKDAGGGTFYDRVYEAERPELFFKAAGWRVRGPGDAIRVRRDARWSVPEPELALVIGPRGTIVGYTAGNDVSSRDIEGENPLYLPQAKVYDGSCALGPAMLVAEQPLGSETRIAVRIARGGAAVFAGETTLAQMRRTPEELAAWLFRETSFPRGAVLLTGTGIVPPDDFTLASGDEVRIEIDGIGALVNRVE
ncbi:fumarylacetoacetate hydrolase family protein [Gemmatirosa kalamazoonensis]|uniref:fumarylacetoacetate hydrolase family protein n=1 Tax=Gemmatirosa kalamazoonensis TaxID=861299 RepID=UPI000CE47151|nr:fumarylacetoacetate hydrolase family protein [Gemmatirosa kalamazoonensis]